MRSIIAHVTLHDVMAEENYMQEVTPNANTFKINSVYTGWYQA